MGTYGGGPYTSGPWGGGPATTGVPDVISDPVVSAAQIAALQIGELSAIDQARASMLLLFAEGTYLTTIGRNYGVPRPESDPNDDDLYRCIIGAIAWRPKSIFATTWRLAECVFGTQADIIAAGQRPWDIFQVNNNEFILEVPRELFAASNENASYMHGFVGPVTTPAGPATDTYTVPDDITEAADSLVGLTVYILYSGVYNAHTINSATYDSGTDTSTVVTSAATIPGGLNSVDSFLDVPGDGVSSYVGDALALDATEEADSTLSGSLVDEQLASLAIIGSGAVTLQTGGGAAWPASGTVTFEPGTAREESFTFTLAADVVTLTSGTTVFEHAAGSFVQTQAAPPAMDHDRRVYLAGNGAIETFVFYQDTLLRAAGIVLRVEEI